MTGSTVLEYLGERRTASEGEKILEKQEDTGCEKYYMFFVHAHQLAIDATSLMYKNKPNYGRYINHSKKFANLKPVIVEHLVIPYVQPTARVIFTAMVDIPAGEEFLWDYDTHKTMLFN